MRTIDRGQSRTTVVVALKATSRGLKFFSGKSLEKYFEDGVRSARIWIRPPQEAVPRPGRVPSRKCHRKSRKSLPQPPAQPIKPEQSLRPRLRLGGTPYNETGATWCQPSVLRCMLYKASALQGFLNDPSWLLPLFHRVLAPSSAPKARQQRSSIIAGPFASGSSATGAPVGQRFDVADYVAGGFGRTRFHDLRGIHATALLDAGIPVHTVAQRIGDDPATLLRNYVKRKRTKTADASLSNAIEALAASFLGS